MNFKTFVLRGLVMLAGLIALLLAAGAPGIGRR